MQKKKAEEKNKDVRREGAAEHPSVSLPSLALALSLRVVRAELSCNNEEEKNTRQMSPLHGESEHFTHARTEWIK
jgi:hypothetical protein